MTKIIGRIIGRPEATVTHVVEFDWDEAKGQPTKEDMLNLANNGEARILEQTFTEPAVNEEGGYIIADVTGLQVLGTEVQAKEVIARENELASQKQATLEKQLEAEPMAAEQASVVGGCV